MHLLCATDTLAPLGALSAQIPTRQSVRERGLASRVRRPHLRHHLQGYLAHEKRHFVPVMYSERPLPDTEQWSQSSGSNVIPRRTADHST